MYVGLNNNKNIASVYTELIRCEGPSKISSHSTLHSVKSESKRFKEVSSDLKTILTIVDSGNFRFLQLWVVQSIQIKLYYWSNGKINLSHLEVTKRNLCMKLKKKIVEVFQIYLTWDISKLIQAQV